MKRFVGLGLLMTVLLFAGGAMAQGMSIAYQPARFTDASVKTSVINGETYLFLPASAQPEALTLYTDVKGELTAIGDAGRSVAFQSGEAFNFASLFSALPKDGKYRITLSAASGECQTLTVMFSSNLSSVYIVSDDPDNEGRAWVDGSEHHETSAEGSMEMLRADGSVVYHGGLKQIRGRGNSTWGNYPLTYATKSIVNKKPYQLTLSRDADLTDTGDPDETNKHWILLAEYYDGTMLHNRVTYDLARELGQASAPNCQSVDLYYDGEYCGQYLLTEKVEVDDGRVDIEDYDKILKTVNRKLGIDLDLLEQTVQTNQDGTKLAATQGVQDGGATTLGGYLIELDNAYYEAEETYFSLKNGMYFTVTNPKYASLNMVSYLSERFEEIDGALSHYGVNPDTGKSWTDLLDVDSILPYYWVNKLAKNPDAWTHSSTYFVLPEGGGKVSMGPVWDFDLSYMLRQNQNMEIGDSLTLSNGESSWAYDLERIPEFQAMAKAFFLQKLVPLVKNVLLGDEDAQEGCLHSLTWYWQNTAASRQMNDVLWDPVSVFTDEIADTCEGNYLAFRSFIENRYAWIVQDVAAWPETQSAANVNIAMSAPYCNVDEDLTATLDDLHTNTSQPTVDAAEISEATEDEYAVWQADLTVSGKPGVPLADNVIVTVNGVAVPATHNADGSVTVSVQFEDPSYKPAEYEDTDYGLVFNADYYAKHYPDVVAQVGDDPDALLAYYVENGIAQYQVANAFFDPKEALTSVPDIADLYGNDGEGAVAYFLDGGNADLMSTLNKTFEPAVWAAEN